MTIHRCDRCRQDYYAALDALKGAGRWVELCKTCLEALDAWIRDGATVKQSV